MKKVILSLSLLTLVLTGTVSCSSDDNSTEQHQQTLVVTSSIGTTVPLHTTVSFVVTVGSDVVTDAQIFIDGKLGSNPFTFTEKGEHIVTAKKEGYLMSNAITITVLESMVANAEIQGTWVPVVAHITIPMAGSQTMPYPHKKNCDDDTLVFDDGYSTQFNFHDDSCTVSSTGSTWAYDATAGVLNLVLFDQELSAQVTSLTKEKLVIKAKGDQFAALIPIIAPELAESLTPAVLALVEVELQFDKQ